MDELVQMVSEKTGIPADAAKTAVTTVVDFIKGKLPGPIASQVDGVLSGDASGAAQGLMGDAAGALGGLGAAAGALGGTASGGQRPRRVMDGDGRAGE